MRILIVEDEKKLAQALQCILAEKKYHPDVVTNGIDAYEYALSTQYDVIVLDIMLPGMDGLTVARKLRAMGVSTPILMLTALSSTANKVDGLNSGADDYMTKPFETDELLARINALTRRHGSVEMNCLSYGDITLNTGSSELCCGNDSINLNYKEAEILKLFLRSPSTVFSKERLIVSVWGADSEAGDSNVEAYISFLRKKLRFINSGVVIRNYQKLGYKIENHEHT